MLALLPLYRRLPREWNVAHLGRRRLSDPEIAHWRDFWKGRGVRYSATASGPTLVITAGGGLPAAKALHYHGRLKPWLLPGAKPLAEPLCRSLAEGGQPQPRDEPCRALWEPYAAEAIARLGLQRSGPGSAAARAELAALAEAKVEPADMPRLAPLEQEAAEAAKPGAVHVALLASAGPPYGLVAAINSTLAHAAAATLPRLRFHVLAPPSEQPALARKLARIFPAEARSLFRAHLSPPLTPHFSPHTPLTRRLSPHTPLHLPRCGSPSPRRPPTSWPSSRPSSAPSACRLRRSSGRSSGSTSPFPQTCAASCCCRRMQLCAPTCRRRPRLEEPSLPFRPASPHPPLSRSAQELASAALHGKAGAAFEDCSVTFDALFNYRHPLFRDRHGRPSCSLDSELLLLDAKAWRKEEAPKQLLELVGFQRRAARRGRSSQSNSRHAPRTHTHARARTHAHDRHTPPPRRPRRNENLFLQPVAALSPHVPAQLLLDKRVLRLPGRWLARGLAREGWSWSEASYWHRLWGLQGVRLPFDVRPVRAVHAAPAPRRASGDALLLRFSGGPMKPWLKRCGGAEAAGAPLCGRSGADCAKLWLRYISEQSLLLAEANEEGSLVAVEGSSARLACVTDLALKKRRAELEALVFDADAAHSRGIERAVVVQAGAPPPPRRARIVYNQTHAGRRGHGHASKPRAASKTSKKREKGSFELPGTALLRGSRPRGGTSSMTSRDARGRER